jgi:hypothetical protein
MANINVPTQACSIGPTEGLFYYIDDSNLVSVNYTGTPTSYYIKASYTNTIKFITFGCSSKSSFDYDGAVVFTAEIGSSDVTFRRWILDLDTIALIETKSVRYNKLGYYSFDIRGFSLEKYVRTVTVSAPAGQSYIYVSNTTHIRPDQECIIGPSTIGACLNNMTFTEVDYVDGNRVYLKNALDNSFAANNSIVFIGDILVSSTRSISNGNMPTLYILDSKSFGVKDYRSIYQIRTISCSEFSNDTLYLCSDYCTYFVNVDTYEVSNILYSYQHCNGDYKNIYSMLVISNELFYTLQKNIVSFSNFNCSVEATSNYNLAMNSFFRYVNSSQITFGSYVGTDQIEVTSKVLDQYAIPMYNIISKFKTSDAEGNFSSNDIPTNISGEAHTVYTIGDDTTQTLTAYSDSTFSWRSSDYVYGDNYINILASKVATNVVYSYGEFESKTLTSFYSNDIESSLLMSPLKDIYTCSVDVDMVSSLDQEIKVESYADKESDSKISLGAGHSIYSEGLVWNAESAYTNPPIDDDTIVSNFIFIDYFLPECGSIKNPRSVNIDFIIFPQTYAFNIPTFSFKIREVNTIFNYDSGFREVSDEGTITLIDLGGGRYSIHFFYSPSPWYKFYSRIYCCLRIHDTAIPPNLFRFNCYFDIIEDYIAPTVITTSPQCDDTDVPKDVDICATIDDVGTGVNPDSVVLMLDGIHVNPVLYTTVSGLLLTYSPSVDFNSGAGVSLSIRVLDMNNNLMLKSCKFYIADSDAPAIVPEDICSDVVDNRFSFYFDVFDTGGGIKFDTVKLFLDNKTADVIVRPVIERTR